MRRNKFASFILFGLACVFSIFIAAKQIFLSDPAGSGDDVRFRVVPKTETPPPKIPETQVVKEASAGGVNVVANGSGFPSPIDCNPQSVCNVLLFGDSLTFGVVGSRASTEKIHPYSISLQQHLDRICPSCWNLVNEGISGERTGHMVPRLQRYLSDQEGGFQFAILLGGTNDLSDPMTTGPLVVDRLRQMLLLLRGKQAQQTGRVLLLGLPELAHANAAMEQKRTLINDQLRDSVCASLSWCVFADLSAAFPMNSPRAKQFWGDDGIHFTVAGYDAFGDLVYNALFNPVITQ